MKKLQKLRERKAPKDDIMQLFSKAEKASTGNESYEWLVEATEPIDPKYTNETFNQGERIRKQLEEVLDSKYSCEFEYQGSVTNDTHVRFHSDIDLLLLHGVYTTYPTGHPIENPVTDEIVCNALVDLRSASTKILRARFPTAKVDDTKSKAVVVSGGSLTRDVDVVICNWWNTQEYLANRILANRGIKVLDISTPQTRIANKPFLHNWHLNSKDDVVGGGLRKAIRLLKNLKYDKDPEAVISSYDIAALVWNMEPQDLNVRPGSYLQLAKNISLFMNRLTKDTVFRDSLKVPNGTRKVFGSDGATLVSLKEITWELDHLIGNISSKDSYLITLSEKMAGFEKLARWREARASKVRDEITRLTKLR